MQSRLWLLLAASAALATPASAQLAWSTYAGGSGDDGLHDVAVGADGHIWAVGETDSTDLSGAPAPLGARDVLVLELSSDGTQLLRVATFGGSGDERGRAIALDGAGHVFVAGDSTSVDFPLLAPLQAAPGGGRDAFLVRLDAGTGAVDRATLLGGSGDDGIGALAVGAAGDVALHGETASSDFPTVAPLQASLAGATDAFLVKLAPDGTVVFSTYLGGSAVDEPDGVGFGVALDAAGALYACGTTESPDFPTANAMQPLHGGGKRDAYFAKLAPGGSLLYATFFGRAGGDSVRACAVDRDGSLVFGGTSRSPDLPLVAPLQWTKRFYYDLLVGRLAPDGSKLSFASYWGANGGDGAKDLALDAAGDIVVVGPTDSVALPLVDPSQDRFGGAVDAFVARFTASGSAATAVSYHGGAGDDAPFEEGTGVAIGPDGSVTAVGTTSSPDLPTSSALDASLGGARDGWIAHFAPTPSLELQVGGGGAAPLATLRVRNPGPASVSLQVKVWIEVPAAGIAQSVVIGTAAFPTLAAGEERVVLDQLALPSTLPFPGTTIGARLLDPASGAIRAERLCSTRPCPVTP